jgi:hypothetical protein
MQSNRSDEKAITSSVESLASEGRVLGALGVVAAAVGMPGIFILRDLRVGFVAFLISSGSAVLARRICSRVMHAIDEGRGDSSTLRTAKLGRSLGVLGVALWGAFVALAVVMAIGYATIPTL